MPVAIRFWEGKHMAKRRSRGSRRVSAAAESTSRRNRLNILKIGGLAGVAIVAVALLALLVPGLSGPSQAADFDFTLYQGSGELGSREMSLSRLTSRPVVLNFWAGQCPPCRAEMPEFQRFYDEYKDRVTLIGIDIGPFTNLGTHRDAEDLLRELGVTYPAGFTNDPSVNRKYGVTAMPTTVFIQPGGEIFEKRTGQLNFSFLTQVTNSMLAAEG